MPSGHAKVKWVGHLIAHTCKSGAVGVNRARVELAGVHLQVSSSDWNKAGTELT